MKTPPIGMTVERALHGVWVDDWVCMIRINAVPPELGVLVWGTDHHRHTPGADRWRFKESA